MRYSHYYIQNCKNHQDIPNIKFAKWMDKIENIIHKKLNLTLLDLPDEMYYDMFENNYTFEAVANNILKEYSEHIF